MDDQHDTGSPLGAEQAETWLRGLGIADPPRAARRVRNMIGSGIPSDLARVLERQLDRHLGRVSDPDMALNHLERFFAAARSPLALASLFDRDPDALPTLLQIFSTSHYLGDLLVGDPDAFDLVRLTEGQPVARDLLVDEIQTDVAAARDDEGVMVRLRRHKRRETLRIAYGDIVRRQSIDVVTRQISWLADAICEAALLHARRAMESGRGVARRADGSRARFVVLGLGKLGGEELNYSSDIDLIFLFDGEGQSDGPRPASNGEYFERMARHFVKLVGEPTELGAAYRIDLRLRPEGSQGPTCIGLDAALRYYDTSGRTWERQAFVKARPVAGDLDLGSEFLSRLEPWVYRRYLSRADIAGIQALKRRIEQRASRESSGHRDVKSGRGGIRDIEFAIQFLQLLNGGDLAELRTGNTLAAIARLEQVGCLTLQERSILETNYTFLRTIEHRLQILFDLRTHAMPDDREELRRLAARLGYGPTRDGDALESFERDYREKTELNRRILDHLLHDAFRDEDQSAPETDLVLDPDPAADAVRTCLGPFGFRDIEAAHGNLMSLATEPIPFLSARRCRHFLASIAPNLLAAIAATPDPDFTLLNLSRVSDSLGGKGVLWELFSFNPPTLNLYVRLCATSPYLSGLLIGSPGMVDELMDSLLVDRLPTSDFLAKNLADLLRGAEDAEPILHSFRNAHHLRVGVRDILGKDDIRDTHRALSDVAEAILTQVAVREYRQLTARYGEPTLDADDRPSEFVMVGMGKLGGREPNYHSDLDVVFLYEGDGRTRPYRSLRRTAETTTNQHFFNQLGQRIIRTITSLGPHGRLYELDSRLRPAGRNGPLVASIPEFERYFASGEGQLWERMALCKARPLCGAPSVRDRLADSIRRILTEPAWQPEWADDLRRLRDRMRETASDRNLKRGPGGTVDIEFIAQMLQLRHGGSHADLWATGTLDALDALAASACLPRADADRLAGAYRFLRGVESRLRLLNTTARHDLPADEAESNRLAYLLRFASGAELTAECRRVMESTRRDFDRIVAFVGRPSSVVQDAARKRRTAEDSRST